MRTCLLAVLLIGCGEESTMTVRDMAVPKPKDLSGLSTDCDVGMQNCPAGKKCVGQFDGSGNLLGTCVTDGTVAEGQPCMTMSSPDTLLDNCQKGFICDTLFGNFDKVCRKMCTTDTDCGTGQKCGDFLFASAGWGWCSPTCVPFDTSASNCPTGMDCGESVWDTEMPDPNLETGFFLCKKTGPGVPYSTCMKDSDCGVGLWCGVVNQTSGQSECLPNCSDTVDCLTPPVDAGVSTTTCHGLATQPDNAGYCLAQ
jgi:hypothetical protein